MFFYQRDRATVEWLESEVNRLKAEVFELKSKLRDDFIATNNRIKSLAEAMGYKEEHIPATQSTVKWVKKGPHEDASREMAKQLRNISVSNKKLTGMESAGGDRK